MLAKAKLMLAVWSDKRSLVMMSEPVQLGLMLRTEVPLTGLPSWVEHQQ